MFNEIKNIIYKDNNRGQVWMELEVNLSGCQPSHSEHFSFSLTPVILIVDVIFMDLYVPKDGDIDKVITIVV